MKDLKKFVCTKKIYPKDYPNDIQQAVKDITYNNYDILFFGSSVFKYLFYAGDIDLLQKIPKNKISNSMKNVIKNLLNKGYIIGDIKAGYKPECEKFLNALGYVELGQIKNYNPDYISKYALKNGYDDLINPPKNYDITLNKWLEVYDKIHQYITLRWRPEDILKGYLIEDNNKYYLDDVIKKNKCNALNKIDIYVLHKNRLLEITNVFGSYTTEFGERAMYDIKINLLSYLTPTKFNLPKAIKRAYTLSRLNTNIVMLNKISPFLISPINYLASFNTDISVVLDMLTVNELTPYKNIIKIHINNLIKKMSNCNYINLNNFIIQLKDTLKYLNNKDNLVEKLKYIKQNLLNIINKLTCKYIKDYEINLNNFVP